MLAGGEGSRLELLTARRAKPALPFAGVYRLIDFPLSNWVHFHEGNADAIWRNRQLIAEHDPEVVLVLSADHVHRLDYGEVLARHRKRGPGVTVVTSEVPEGEASPQAVVEVAGDGPPQRFHYKPDEPPTTRVATEVFAFATRRLLDTLEELAGEGELQDFGHGLLPRLVEAGGAVEHRMAGYGRNVGTVPADGQAHMDLLDPERPPDLDDPDCPILGRAPHRLPARVKGSARLEGAPLSPGSVVCGEVTRSVLGPGVVVEPGAAVRDAVPLDDCVVAGDAREEAHVPRGATVAPGGRLGQHGAREPAA